MIRHEGVLMSAYFSVVTLASVSSFPFKAWARQQLQHTINSDIRKHLSTALAGSADNRVLMHDVSVAKREGGWDD